ncbi:MAG: endolytic transglycosylase MltG [Gemmatimonadaceae bacterium]|nr:endolytic transglycosylase MltG [Gemmatimonadaceae bacterium]
MARRLRRRSALPRIGGFVAAGVFALAAFSACTGDDTPRRVVIPAGSTFRVAADSLGARGVIRFPRLFTWYASATDRDRSIRAGTYQFTSNQSWSELLAALAAGRGLIRSVTIPEGWNLGKIVPQLARVLEVPVDSVEAAVRDSALRHRLDVPTPTLEGYLFPDTYAFPPGASARDAVGAMVARFESMWKPEWTEQGRAMKMTRHDLVTLAAIIETEARVPEERPVISAVYHNRLKVGMRLQADPTVQYALGRHVERVLYKDLEVDSRYNTYRYTGLPPGPIASPGAPSMAAAAGPASVPFLYFVAHPDGHHEFRRTFREHAAAIREVRRAARPAAAR